VCIAAFYRTSYFFVAIQLWDRLLRECFSIKIGV
jgi:hypothetical protein